MGAAKIKNKLFRKLDSLQGKRLEEAYGMLLNHINGKNEVEEWQNLTTKQQSAILTAIKQLDNKQGRSHDEVMGDFRNRYTND